MRRRLIALVAATTSLVLVAFLVPLALLIQTVVEDRAMAAALTRAESLDAVVATGDEEAVTTTLRRLQADETYPVTLFLPDGTVRGAPAPRSDAVELASRGRSLTADTEGGREILVHIRVGGNRATVIRTFVSDTQLNRGVLQSWLALGALGLALLLLGLVVADRLARRLLVPLTDLGDVSHRLAGGDLYVRAAPDGPPEIREVAGGLNHLADRIAELLAAERERIADLSHRLRTPLTALRLEAESLPTANARERIEESAASLERVVSRTIDEARRPHEAEPVSCDAVAVVRERVEFWSVLAEDQERQTSIDVAHGPVMVRLDAHELASALDALLGNIFAHTPEGTAFSVRLAKLRPDEASTDPRIAAVEIADEGPGLPTGAVERGESGGGSTGLGLDIARRAAKSSGGSFHVGPGPAGGTRIVLRLAVATPSANGPAGQGQL